MALDPPKYLPEDILRPIFSKLPVKSLNRCRCVCKTWYRIIGLPNNILINILRRLPLQYAVRCRCVCKTWYHIIGTTSFAKTHLSYQKTAATSNKFMLYEQGNLCTLLAHSHSIYDGSLKHSKLMHLKQVHVKDIVRRCTGDVYMSFRRPKIRGICNGLLCLSDSDYDIGDTIYLWNPTCRKIKKLPRPDNNSIIKDALRYSRTTSLSFGYYDDDFKVIAIAIRAHAYFVLVYSLNTNSWNTIPHKFYDDVYFEGRFYRYTRVNDTKFVDDTVYIIESDQVRCFDLSNETICTIIPFPKELGPCVHDKYTTDFTTEIYGDSIAIFIFELQSRSLTMWILKDKSSFVRAWEKRLDNIKNSSYSLVGLLNNGKYLVNWEKEGPKKCYLCDIDSPRVREVTFMRGSPYIYDSHIHPNYVESLFLLNEDHLDPVILYDINGNSLPESAV
ncbi:putative F-box protein At3g49520 [Apium graveolens]|uniref:putative F-box protein At3g49520 n=1 Tax=Apium graveolens TaxID=4045 RepID=UPI003D7AF879